MSPPADAARSIYLPPWRIDLVRRASVVAAEVPLPGAALARAVAAALAGALAAAPAPAPGPALAPASIGLILAGDPELAQLNAAHLGKTGPTDVLSFPLLPPDAYRRHQPGPGDARSGHQDAGTVHAPDMAAPFVLPPGRRTHLGDIVVSVERAADQARSGRGGQTGDVRWTPADELRLLVVHGILHICGWDHAEPEEEAAMRALEREILTAL